MRKGWIVFLSLMAALLLWCLPACGEVYVLDNASASIDIPDGYVVLTPDNLGEYLTWMEGRGLDADNAALDFERRGVALQCWSIEDTVCFEVRVNETEKSKVWFDINEQTTSTRGQYRLSHYPNNDYEGYTFSTAEWKNTVNGRFLVLRYTRKEAGETLYKGFMRRTIRNGYEIDLDMQIYDRKETASDNNALNKIWNTFNFIELKELPAIAGARVNISEEPPQETNSQTFTIEGTASEGVSFTAVVMGLSSPDPVVTQYVVGKNGKISMPIRLPKEGVFLVTLTAEYKDEEILELAYPVTYQHTLLTVNFKTKPDEVVKEDTVTIAGTAEAGASIQIFINDEVQDKKHVTPQGKFSLELPCKEEGAYEIVLCFSQKGLADRRFTFNFTRQWTDADMLDYVKKQAISPSYGQLVNKIKNYTGRIMGYKAYLTDVSQSGDKYVLTMALNKKKGNYTNLILVTTSEAPSFSVGERVWMYGTCEGLTTPETDGEGTSSQELPCFSLLMLASIAK